MTEKNVIPLNVSDCKAVFRMKTVAEVTHFSPPNTEAINITACCSCSHHKLSSHSVTQSTISEQCCQALHGEP